MNSENDVFVYMMAAEKMSNMLFTIEQTMDFMEEYKIKPDDEVKKALTPLLIKLHEWVKKPQAISPPTK